jgi:ligand-binding SRPBCC domain-containing protein
MELHRADFVLKFLFILNIQSFFQLGSVDQDDAFDRCLSFHQRGLPTTVITVPVKIVTWQFRHKFERRFSKNMDGITERHA